MHWDRMAAKRTEIILWLFVLLLAAGLRLPHLARRPMHTDEAVHAIKFAALLEEGHYLYDAREYHGPALYYFTLIPACLRGQTSLAALDETTLRLVPVCFGLGLVLLPLLLRPFIGGAATLAAAFAAALSPMLVFYSRYYIQEVLLVFFAALTLICIGRYLLRPQRGWILGAGAALGVLHATKETDILILAAAALAAFMTAGPRHLPGSRLRRDILLGLAVALGVTTLMFTAGLSHPAGLLDSFRAYGGYVQRGTGQTVHIQGWSYYFRLLFWWHEPGHPWWSEIWIVPFLAAAIWSAWPSRKDRSPESILRRFMIYFTLILTILFCLLPYKTPWNALGFYYSALLLAGIGWAWLAKRSKRWHIIVLVFIGASGLLLLRQALQLNGDAECDPGNPWVYAHPGPDVARITAAVQAAAQASPEGAQMPLQVSVIGSEYWPLPWTLRALVNITWLDRLNPGRPAAPVVLISPDQEAALLQQLYETPPPGERSLYLPLWQEYTELRPGQEIRGYIRKDLYDLLEPAALRAAGEADAR